MSACVCVCVEGVGVGVQLISTDSLQLAHLLICAENWNSSKMEEPLPLNNNDDAASGLSRNSTVDDLEAARAQIKEADETKRLLKQFAEIRKLCAGEITSTRFSTCTTFVEKIRKLCAGEITSTSFLFSFVEDPDADEVRIVHKSFIQL